MSIATLNNHLSLINNRELLQIWHRVKTSLVLNGSTHVMITQFKPVTIRRPLINQQSQYTTLVKPDFHEERISYVQRGALCQF